MRIAGVAVLLIAVASYASAAVPEIDGGFAVSAFGLIAGVALIVRSRRRK